MHFKFTKLKLLLVCLLVWGGANLSQLAAQTCPTSNGLLINVSPDPTISITGAITICEGGNATLTATVAGGDGTCTIQWQSSPNGTSSWTPIAGANAATYTATGLTTTTYYRATYTCTAVGCDAATSNAQTITVVPDPTTTISVNNPSVCIGGPVTVTATVSGGSGTVSYQWQSSPNGTTWTNVSGATSSTYSPSTSSVGVTHYQVLVTYTSNGCNVSTSNSLTVTVLEDPSAVIAVNNPAVCVGGTANLTSTVTGGSGTISYQWQSSPNGTTWTNVSGATASSYSAPTTAPGVTQYRVLVNYSNGGCDQATSNSVTVTVIADPAVTITGDGTTICTGGTHTLNSTVTGGSGTVSYQWQSSPNSTTWTDISGATAANYTTTALTASTYFRLIVNYSNSGCNTATSSPAQIIVVPDPSITIAGALTVCEGGSTNLTATVAGGTGTCTIQWQYLNVATWTNIPGANAAVYTTPNLTQTTIYRASYSCTGVGCDAATSNTQEITVVNDPNVSIAGGAVTVCTGGSVLLSATVTGGTGTVSYQWQNSTNNTTFTNISGATNSTLNTGALAQTTYYKVNVVFSGNGCDNTGSGSSQVNVVPDPTASITGPTEICTGGTSTLTATVSGGTGTCTIQWQKDIGGGIWQTIAGQSGTTYTTDVLTVTTKYRIRYVCTGGGCDAAISNELNIVVLPDPVATVTVNNPSVCVGGSAILTVTTTGGSGTPAYQWQSSTNGITWTNVSGATSSTFTAPTTAPGVIYYQVLVNFPSGGCDQSTSNNLTVTVIADPTATITVNNPAVCVGGSAILSAATTGGSGTVSYQWQSSPNGTTWTNVSGATAFTYTAPTATVGTVYYRVLVNYSNSGCDQATSNSLTVIVSPDPTASITVNNAQVCEGGSVLLTATTTGGSGTVSYQWQSSPNGTTWTNVSGATAATYTAPTSTPGTVYYRILVNFANNGCDQATSNSLTVLVIADPAVNVTGGNITICSGGGATLTSNVTGGQGTVSYQWQSSPNGTTWTDISGATASTYAVVNLTATTQYRVNVSYSGSGCNGAASAPVTITVVPDPVISVAGDSQICVGGSVQLTASVSGGTGTCTLQWQDSPNGTTWTDIAGQNATTYQTPALGTNKHFRATYSCTGNGCCD